MRAAAAFRRYCQIALLIIGLMLDGGAVAAEANAAWIRIGVLTKGNEPLTLQRWSSTADYLHQHIAARHFRIVPLDFSQIEAAVSGAEIDFLLANPAIFAEMETAYGAAAMLTLKRRVLAERSAAVFAGAIVVKAGRHDLRGIEHLKNMRFAAVDPTSFGGWAMAWRQMKLNAIDPFVDLAGIKFLGSHEAVVQAVLDGTVDAGTVRTGVLEQMASTGRLDLDQVHVMMEQGGALGHPSFELSLLHSTAYYPEWPLASLPHTDSQLVKQVALALLAMNAGDPAARAAGIAGWQPPANYLPVHDLMRDLKLAQYQHFGEVELLDAARQHWRWAALIVLALLLLTALVVYVLRLNRHNAGINRRLRTKNQRIQESEQRLAAILDNVLEAVVTIDFAGNIQTFNRAAEMIFGYRQHEVVGCNVSMLMPAPVAAGHDQFIGNYIRTGEATIIGIGRESEGLRKNGEVFPLELAVSEVALRGERMFVGILRDLSEKKAHEERRRQMERLEALSKMAGGFAHEFNNLLSSIVGYTDMLLLELGDAPERTADLRQVMDAALRAKLLVKQLLDVSRSDYEAALVLMPQKIVTEVVELLQSLLPDGAEIHSDLQCQACQVLMSPLNFQQIVMNLGMNAIEALAEGGRIDISLECGPLDERVAADMDDLAAGEYAVLTVSDDGRGIAAERLAHIFEPVFTNHDVVKDQVVGLAAIKEIIHRHHGAVEVHSAPGTGTCFKVYLPCTRAG